MRLPVQARLAAASRATGHCAVGTARIRAVAIAWCLAVPLVPRSDCERRALRLLCVARGCDVLDTRPGRLSQGVGRCWDRVHALRA